RFFRGFLQTLKRQLVLLEIDAVLFFELIAQITDDPIIEILAAEEGIAVRRFHLEDAIADLEDRNVEGAAAKVIDRDRAAAFLVEAVGECRRSRLVDD